MNWEQAMQAFAGTGKTGSMATRDEVATGDWTPNRGVKLVPANGYDPKSYDVSWASDPVDLTTYTYVREFAYPSTSSYRVIVWTNLTWSDFTSSDSQHLTALDKFSGASLDILNQANPPSESDTTSVGSFNAAITMLTGLESWINQDMHKMITGLADQIDASDSDFQGSAAGELKSYLLSVDRVLTDMWRDLQAQGDPVTRLTTARDDLQNGLHDLLAAYWNWRGDKNTSMNAAEKTQYASKMSDPSLAYPVNCVANALFNALTGATLQPDGYNNYKVIANGVDVSSDGFWASVSDSAKNIWKQAVVDHLDAAVTTFMNKVAGPNGSFSNAAQKLNATSVPQRTPQGTAITPPDPNGGNGPGGSTNPNDPNGLNGPNGANGPGGANGSKDLNGPGGKGPKLDGSNTNGPNGLTTPPPPHAIGLNQNKNSGPPTIDTSGTGGNVPLLDANGKPLTQPNGQPWTVPPGSTIDANGNVIGPNGKPLIGPDGKPERVPKGTKVGTSNVEQGPISLGGGPYAVPPGSKVDGNGMVVGPDGKPVLDANGNPVYAGKNATINKNGQILGANGKPVSQQDQLLANEEHAMTQPPTLNLTGGTTTGYTPGEDLGASSPAGPHRSATASGSTAWKPPSRSPPSAAPRSPAGRWGSAHERWRTAVRSPRATPPRRRRWPPNAPRPASSRR